MLLTIVQWLLAALFLMAGFMKSTTPRAKFVKKMPWAKEVLISAAQKRQK